MKPVASIEASRIVDYRLLDVDVALEDEFVISRGKLEAVQNAFVRLTLASGHEGFGEIAPFPALTGETRSDSRAAAQRLLEHLQGRSVLQYRGLIEEAAGLEPRQPAARCGVETAILDALTRFLGIPMWAFFGGAALDRAVRTDITLPILPTERTRELARGWYRRGFRTFKTKVGAESAANDLERISLLHRELDGISFVIDANQGFAVRAALDFVGTLRARGVHIVLLEQPVGRADLDGMRAIREAVDFPVAADESVASPEDALRLIAAGAADVINLKIMKSGVLGACRIAELARSAGLRLMIGGMMETRLAMGCSLALVLGRGDIEFVDLDTPLLLRSDPVEGGYRYDGELMLAWPGPGLDIRPAAPAG